MRDGVLQGEGDDGLRELGGGRGEKDGGEGRREKGRRGGWGRGVSGLRVLG